MEKKIVIGFVTPNRFFAPWETVESIMRIPREYTFSVKKGAVIDENRNWLFQENSNADVLLMVDADMVFTPDDVQRIVQHILNGKDYVCGLFNRGYKPTSPVVYSGYDEVARRHIQSSVQQEVFQVYASGMAFVAVSKNVLTSLGKRPFDRIIKNNILLGEDLSFCQRVREAGFTLWCDPSIKIGHVISEVI